MRQLKIGEYKTYDNWGLILQHKYISPPEIKQYSIEIPGRNGSLDITESMGGVRYEDREVSFTLMGIDDTYEKRIEKYNMVVAFFHGQIREIEEPDRPDEVLKGRWSVSEPTMIEGELFEFKISCKKVYPYYLSTDKKTSIHNLSGSDSYSIRIKYDGKVSVWPMVRFTGNGTINIAGDSIKYNLTSKDTQYGHVKLDSGYNNFIVQGSGTLTITYRNEAM